MGINFDKISHVYRISGEAVPSVTQILKAEGFINTAFYNDYNRDRGSAIHKAIHLYEQDDLDEESLDPAIRPYLDDWIMVKRSLGLVVSASERVMAHPTLRFAGTADILGTNEGGNPVLIDIKTGGPEPWHGLQLAAYEILDGSVGRKRIGVYLSGGDRPPVLKGYTDRQDRATFMAALATHNWKRNHNMKGCIS